MHDLTQRQVDILKSLIEEYINSAEAVGSETLEKKYSLSSSPATIRNEMVKLTELGYLKKAHSSAGRIPTAQALKFYVKQLMKEKELSVAEEVSVKEKVWDLREKQHACLKQLTKSLAERTKALAVATTNDGEVIYSGYANILLMPEFFDIRITQRFLTFLDSLYEFESILESMAVAEEVQVLLGEDLTPMIEGPYGFVFGSYATPLHKGQIGVLGPTRLNYSFIIPTVRYYTDLVEEIAEGW